MSGKSSERMPGGGAGGPPAKEQKRVQVRSTDGQGKTLTRDSVEYSIALTAATRRGTTEKNASMDDSERKHGRPGACEQHRSIILKPDIGKASGCSTICRLLRLRSSASRPMSIELTRPN